MEKKVKKFGLRKMLAVLAIAFACVCMWGCTEVTFEWYDERSKPSVAGFINDSLVVVTDCRGWYEDTETKWNSGYSTVTSCGHDRMMVYNYRVQEDGPRWSDSLTNEYDGQRWFQMTDSVFWRWNGDDILLWKVGEKSHEMRLSRKNDGCSQSFKIERIRQWLDGKFIALGGKLNGDGDICQYAVLDTVAKMIAYKRLDKDLEWIKECDDVRAWGDDIYCLIFDEKDGKSFMLKNEKDRIYAPMDKLFEGHFSGNMMELGVRICSLIKDKIECSDIKWTGNKELEFYRNDGTVIYLK